MVLVVRNHLLEVPVQLGGELLVPEGAALLVKDFVDGGDQLQLLLSFGLGEAVDTEGVQHHRGTLELLVSQVPGNWRVFFSLSLYHLGTITPTKFNEFSENFQTASDPSPTIFSENNVALFSGGPKICNEIHSDWRDPPPFFRKFIVFTAPKFPEKPQRNFSDRK